jgi:hypothetical protein
MNSIQWGWAAMALGWAALVVQAPAQAQTPAQDARALMEASEQRTKSRTETTVYRMELMDATGQVLQTRGIVLHYKRVEGTAGAGGVESTLFKFTAPAVVQGTGLLIVDSGQAVNDIWMYLPATRRIRRIAGAEKSNWFMGTEFTHEDFEDYQLAAYRFTLTQPAQPCGQQQRCDVVTAVASDPAEQQASGYGSKVYWIEKETLYPVRIDYLDKQGAPAKRLDVHALVRIGQHWRPERYEMRNLANGRLTRLTATAREVDTPLDDHLVSQRFLRTD